MNSHLLSAFIDDAAYPAGSQGSDAADPQSVGIGFSYSYPTAECLRRLLAELDRAPLAALAEDAKRVVLRDVLEFQVRDLGQAQTRVQKDGDEGIVAS